MAKKTSAKTRFTHIYHNLLPKKHLKTGQFWPLKIKNIVYQLITHILQPHLITTQYNARRNSEVFQRNERLRIYHS